MADWLEDLDWDEIDEIPFDEDEESEEDEIMFELDEEEERMQDIADAKRLARFGEGL